MANMHQLSTASYSLPPSNHASITKYRRWIADGVDTDVVLIAARSRLMDLFGGVSLDDIIESSKNYKTLLSKNRDEIREVFNFILLLLDIKEPGLS